MSSAILHLSLCSPLLSTQESSNTCWALHAAFSLATFCNTVLLRAKPTSPQPYMRCSVTWSSEQPTCHDFFPLSHARVEALRNWREKAEKSTRRAVGFTNFHSLLTFQLTKKNAVSIIAQFSARAFFKPMKLILVLCAGCIRYSYKQ